MTSYFALTTLAILGLFIAAQFASFVPVAALFHLYVNPSVGKPLAFCICAYPDACVPLAKVPPTVVV